MTTDITELARERLKEKFDVWFEREYKHLESSKYTDAVPHIKYGFWTAYQAGGAELVEALEKAQAKNALVAGGIEASTKLHERIAELDAELEREREKSRRMMSRIAELESRTVKLPDLRQIVSGDRYVWSDGVYNYSQDVKAALAAAGIKWEAE